MDLNALCKLTIVFDKHSWYTDGFSKLLKTTKITCYSHNSSVASSESVGKNFNIIVSLNTRESAATQDYFNQLIFLNISKDPLKSAFILGSILISVVLWFRKVSLMLEFRSGGETKHRSVIKQ